MRPAFSFALQDSGPARVTVTTTGSTIRSPLLGDTPLPVFQAAVKIKLISDPASLGCGFCSSGFQVPDQGICPAHIVQQRGGCGHDVFMLATTHNLTIFPRPYNAGLSNTGNVKFLQLLFNPLPHFNPTALASVGHSVARNLNLKDGSGE